MSDLFNDVTRNFLASLSRSLPSRLVVRNGCFVTVVPSDAPEIENIVIRHQVVEQGAQLIAGTCDKMASDPADTQAYAMIFGRCLLGQYRKYVVQLVHFSKKRDIGDRTLYQEAHFRQVVGEILQWMELTELSLSEANFNLKLAFEYLAQISRRCVKVLGGRSLLSGSVFDLQVICQLVEDTYVK